MEDRTYRITIGIVISAAIFAVAVFGSYLPMRKAEMFISTLQSLQTSPASSLNDLETRIAKPLDYPSPIGQEELVRNTANSVLAFVQQGGDPTSTKELITFLNHYYDPIIARGKGMSFGQDLYLQGVINEVAFVQTGDQTYLNSSLMYYKEGNELGPNRPQTLYGLFDDYRAAADATNTIATAQKILANWPSDTRIQDGLQQFEAQHPTSTRK